jgi:DNA polymerase-3 subunit beta
MNISINKNVLENMLVNSLSFLDKKDSSQITSHILINAHDGMIDIKATDYEIGIEMESKNVNIALPGVATANGKKLLDVVKMLKDEDINLKTEADFLYIKQHRSKFKLPMFNAMEYPDFPEIENKNRFEIEPVKFLNAIKKIQPSIDTNNPKFELNGALIDIKKEKINFVSTDTRRLALVSLEKENQEELSLIIPKKAISEMQKLFFDEMNIYYDENIMIVKSENFSFFTKLINGKFPEYERIIPKDKKYELTLNRDMMIDHLKQISIVSQEIKLTFRNDAIIFESLNDENFEGRTQLDFISNLTEDIVLAVNSKYILDFLTHIEKNEFKLRYNDATLPFMLECDNFITVIMPIML